MPLPQSLRDAFSRQDHLSYVERIVAADPACRFRFCVAATGEPNWSQNTDATLTGDGDKTVKGKTEHIWYYITEGSCNDLQNTIDTNTCGIRVFGAKKL